MCQYIEQMVTLVSQRELTREEGRELAQAISMVCNTYSYGRVYKAIPTLSKKGRDRLVALTCMIGLIFASEREDRGKPTWDDRKRASEDFAFLHRWDFLTYLQGKNAIIGERLSQSLSEQVTLSIEERRSYEQSFPSGFLAEWRMIHPTLQQIFFGQMVRVLIEQGVLNCEVPRFPFI